MPRKFVVKVILSKEQQAIFSELARRLGTSESEMLRLVLIDYAKEVSYQPLKDVDFLLPRPGLDPHTSTAETSANEAVSARHLWKAGYRGPPRLRRHNFGLPHA
ncbi:MAG: hypothetical protein ACPLIG_03885 [Candidatus Bathyarchaeales archaeon]